MSEFMDWLDGRVEAVAALERKAAAILAGDDFGDYASVMREKADLLAGLADEGDNLLQSLPADSRRPAKERLARFSASAETALSLGSVWFMSALLYPEEHKEGEPNDLERFRDSLR